MRISLSVFVNGNNTGYAPADGRTYMSHLPSWRCRSQVVHARSWVRRPHPVATDYTASSVALTTTIYASASATATAFQSPVKT